MVEILLERLMRSSRARRLQRRLVNTPGNSNIFTGEYRSFAEAEAAIPRGEVVGYDNSLLASWYRERLDKVHDEDYPLLFWLQRLAPALESVLDFGGHVGLHFYAWKPLLGFPQSLRWQVCEVPAVAEAGRALAKERGASQLTFTSDVAQADGVSLFLASGSLQYLEPGFLWRSLGALKQRPKHLLLNKLPVHESRGYVTVQDTRSSFHPYTVTACGELERELKRLGYRKEAEWKNPGFDCRIVLQPALDVPAYSGGYWTLA